MGVWVLPTANSLDVIKKVRDVIPGHRSAAAGGMKVGHSVRFHEYIQDAINEVFRTLTETLLIVIVVIFLFLVLCARSSSRSSRFLSRSSALSF